MTIVNPHSIFLQGGVVTRLFLTVANSGVLLVCFFFGERRGNVLVGPSNGCAKSHACAFVMWPLTVAQRYSPPTLMTVNLE